MLRIFLYLAAASVFGTWLLFWMHMSMAGPATYKGYDVRPIALAQCPGATITINQSDLAGLRWARYCYYGR